MIKTLLSKLGRTPENDIAATHHSEEDTFTLIRVTPKNIGKIAKFAIPLLKKPVVLLESRPIKDYSDAGPLRHVRLKDAQDFEIRDGEVPVMGFHGGSKRMWFNNDFMSVARDCETEVRTLDGVGGSKFSNEESGSQVEEICRAGSPTHIGSSNQRRYIIAVGACCHGKTELVSRPRKWRVKH